MRHLGGRSLGGRRLGGQQLVRPGRMTMSPHRAMPMPVTASHVGGYDFSGVNSDITVTGSGISAITDASGNGNTAIQTSDANRPPYGTRTVNGLLVADVVAGDQLDLPNQGAWTGWANVADPPLTYILVVVKDNTNANDWPLKCVGTLDFGFVDATNRWTHRYAATGPVQGSIDIGDVTVGDLAVLVGTLDTDGSGTGSLNGGADVTVADVVDSGEALSNNKMGAGGYDGAFCEEHFFDAVLSADEQAEWLNYLLRWGNPGEPV